jgi:predicted amidohydrolase YtcJ
LEEKGSKMCIANSLALEKLSKTPIQGVTVMKTLSGELTGIIRVDDENLLYKAIDIPTLDPVDNYLPESELERAIEIASRKVVKAGITSIHDPQLPPNALRAFKNTIQKGKTPLRLYLGCDKNKDIGLDTYVKEGLGTEPYPFRLKIGMVKLFADDRISRKEFKKRVKEAHDGGFQLAIHATNIMEMKNALEVLEEVLADNPRDNHRHRIEHADNLEDDTLERVRILGLIVATQPEIVFKLEPNYPENVMKVAYNSMVRARINVSGGSDSPTVPIKLRSRPPLAYPTPLIGMGFAVSRKTKNGILIDESEGVSMLEALKIYTINGAYASFEEDVKGTLEAGKLADFIVLSDDPFNVVPEDIGKIKVEMTIIGGKIV